MSGLVARTFVLLADMRMDLAGILSDHGLEALDEFDRWYRDLYFFRANTRTLSDVQKLVADFSGNAEFRALLDTDPKSKRRWRALHKRLNRTEEKITAMRNSIGGHVDEAYHAAVEAIDPGSRGYLGVGGRDLINPQLATPLVLAALVPEKGNPEGWWRKVRDQMLLAARTTRVARSGLILALALCMKRNRALVP